IIIYRNGKIKINYLELVGNYTDGWQSVGIENIDGTDGLQVAFNTDYLHDDLAILFSDRVEWITIEEAAGIISAGGSQDIEVTFDAAGLLGGDYASDIIITSNDPDENPVIVPATMGVTGAASLNVDPDIVDYGELFVGGTYPVIVTASNQGTDLLIVSDIQTTGGEFSADETLFSLAPGETYDFDVTFSPSNIGFQEGVLTLSSNDPSNPTVAIPLSGTGVTAPDIAWTPTSMSADLFTGDTEVQTLTISNEGGSALDWEIGSVVGERMLPDLTQAEIDRIRNNYVPDENDNNPGLPHVSAIELETFLNLEASREETVHILGWSAFADEVGEVVNTLEAISMYFTDFTIVNTYATDAATLESELEGKSLFLVYEQEYGGFDFDIMATEIAPVLQDFVNAGGGIVFCGMNSGNAQEFMFYTGFFTGMWVGDAYGEGVPLSVVEYNEVTEGVEPTFAGPNATFWCDITDADAQKLVQTDAGEYDLVTTRDYGSGRAVFVGFDYYDYESNSAQLIANAVRWAGNASRVNWLSFSEEGGMLAAGASQDIEVTFDASDMIGGEYIADIIITSNDPDENPAIIPATLNVTGAPSISVDPGVVDYGEQYVGGTYVATLVVSNGGTDVLDITDVQTAGGEFSADETLFSLAPGEAHNLDVTFAPTSIGFQDGGLTITSNDPTNPTVSVGLSGTAVTAPDIAWTPTSMSADLFTGDTETQTLTLSNEGGSDLTWSISFEESEAARSDRNIGFYADESRVAHQNNAEYRSRVLQDNPGARSSRDGSRDTGDILGEFSNYLLNNAGDVWADGDLYSVTWNDNGLYRYDFETGEMVYQFAVDDDAHTMTFDGDYFWVATGTGNVYGYDMEGTEVGSFSTPFDWYILITWDGDYFIVNDAPDFDLDNPFYRIDYDGTVVETIYSTYDGYSNGAVWVEGHPDGELWVNDYVFQSIAQLTQEGDQFNLVNLFYYGDYAFANYDLAHDGVDLFSSPGNGTLYQVDDGIEEQNWLTADIEGGTISAGSSQDVLITFDATGLFGGDYMADIIISSNDPNENPAIIPATLNVTGAPSISVDPLVIDYGEVYVGGTYPATVEVSNPGTDLLDVTDIQIAGGEFSLDDTPFSLNPGEDYDLVVTFMPTTIEVQTGSITLTCNDPTNPTVSVSLTGNSVAAPDIAWTPTSMSAALFTGDTETQTLTLSNEGGSDLFWEIGFADPVAGRVINNTIPEIEAPPSGETTTTPHTQVPSYYGAFGSTRTDEEVLVVRDFMPWGGDVVPYWLDLETIVTVISSSDLAGTDLTDYDVLYWGGDEGFEGGFYTNIAAKMDDIDTFLNSGGVVFSATGSQGGEFVLPGEVQAIFNNNDVQYPEDGHCVTEGLPTEVWGTSSYHDIFDNFGSVPGGVDEFSFGTGGETVGIAYDWGLGHAIFIGNPSEYYLSNPDSYPDQVAMWVNAAFCALENTGPDWLTSDISAGTIAAGASQDILITFDATGMFGGDYFMDIVVASNDPDENPVIIPAALNVTGAPSIAVDPDAVDFGEVYVGGTYLVTVNVSNPGTDLLDVTDIQITGGEFSLDATPFSLGPGENYPLVVTFMPTSIEVQNGEITLTCNDPTNPTVLVSLTGNSVAAPDITWTPASMSADLFTGDTETQTLTISNEGGSDLVWEISIEETDAVARSNDPVDDHPSHYLLDVEKGAVDPRVGPDVIRDAGGPDLFGYSWIDSDEAGGPVFNWEDISGTGTNITGNMWDDNVSGPYPLGFEFDFYENTYTEFYVSSNGFIRFDYNDNSGCCSGQPIPLDDGINNIIAWAWRDGYPFGNTYYENFDDKTIIQFDGYGTCCSQENGSATTEIILYRDGKIKINYLELVGNYTDGWHSVGIENSDGTDGLQVAFNTDYLHDELALVFADTPDWVIVDQYLGVLAAGSSQDVQVTFDATGLLGGDYTSDIMIISNDPDESLVIIPATLSVTGASDIEVSSDVIEYGEVFILGSLTYDLLISNAGTDVLDITNIQISGGDFSVDATTASLAPGESFELEVTFAPAATGAQTESLTIFNNDPSSPEYVVNLTGTGIVPPDISWTPEIMSAVLNLGETEIQTMTITNDGGSVLDWSLNIHELTARDLERNIGFYADESRTPLPDAHPMPGGSGESDAGVGETSDETRDLGDLLGEYWAPDPNGATGMIWIGGELIVVSYVNEEVARVNLDTGEYVALFPTHAQSFGLAWDGQYLWIGDGSGNVYGYTLEGVLVGSFSTPEFGHLALTWDGSSFLIASAFAYNPTVFKLDFSGNILASYESTFDATVSQMTWVPSHEDGNLWTVDESTGTVRRLNLSGDYFNEVSSFYLEIVGFRYAITHDGYDLWIAEWNGPYYQVDDGIEEQHWVYADIVGGSLEVGSSQDIEITFSALDVGAGEYMANIFIYSNDPDESEVTIPVTITVNPVGIADLTQLPESFILQDNFPNPFNPSTTLRYGIPVDSEVSLIIYDIRGNVVESIQSGMKQAGWYDFVWRGLNNSGHVVATGVYFARFQAGDYSRVVKLVYLK
ncbi:choice-of-anchor D domain-containing protein, partial [bacterium]|nr:choice-of-anchor D domain-containing protein [bacterium]